MSRIKKIIFFFIIAFLFQSGIETFANDIIITEKSDQGLTIEFTPGDWEIKSESVNSKSYFKINFSDCCFKTSIGSPLIPYRTTIIGIPFGASVSLQILDIKKKQSINGKIVPVPEIGEDGMGKIQYRENSSVYSSNQLFPEQIAEISEPLIMRDQQVVALNLFPVQFNPVQEQIQLYDRISVRLNFIGGKQKSTPTIRSDYNYLYDQVLLNSGQSAKWRKSQRKLAKRLKASTWGDFYKIYISEDGIYKITGNDLKNAGLDLNLINPNTIKIFNNGGFQLPHKMYLSRPDSLIENAIIVEDGGDDSFDDNDYILFFGRSVNGWEYNSITRQFSHYLNSYTRENVYWLGWQDLNPGKRMQSRLVAPSQPVVNVSNFWDHIYRENEFKNVLNSGTCWLGNFFSAAVSERNYQFNLTGALPDEQALIRINLAGISNNVHRFLCYFNDSIIGTVPDFYGATTNDNIRISMKQFSTVIDGGLIDGNNRLKIKYHPRTDASLAYMDWIELDYMRRLKAENDRLLFYSPDSNGYYKYSVQSFSADNIFVFDVSHFHDVTLIDYIQNSDTVEFVDSTFSTTPKTYLAISSEQFKQALNIEKDLPSQWRNFESGADFIIITYDDFYDAALQLKSLRENCDTLKTEVVNISDVFDEFAWGLKDPTAIRDFIKYAYDNWQPKPEYVLLFGDGDYDYKNFISPYDPNWILPFETDELNDGSSRARDDWYVCVAGNDDLMELAIGRIPVRNFDQALHAVKKIIDYQNAPAPGDWCNRITMVADDEFVKGGDFDPIDHVPDVENIAEKYIPKTFNVQKIYLTEYPAVHNASISGIRKPAATEALLKQINQGCLIVNFVGHGGDRLWAHERVLEISDHLPRIDNGKKQALWIAATCSFGKYDNPEFQSFAEQVVTVSDRGAIASFSACRKSYADRNVSLNKSFYRKLFPGNYKRVRIGDAVLAAKNSRGNPQNDQFYHLLGDPTLVLSMPTFKAGIISYDPDSIRALTLMKAEGVINNPVDSSTVLNGKVLFTVYDSRKQRTYKVTKNKAYRYKLPGNAIFRGIVTVTNNLFESQFIVPKDITYGGSDGKLSAFYWDDFNSGSGCLSNIPVGGTQTEFFDNKGPLIKIDFVGQNFLSGGFVPPNSEMNITIEDNVSGVNIAGDIGHKITMTLNGEEDKKADLTDYFQYDENSYTIGKINYPLTNLTEGDHQIRIKAWDNSNNSSISEVELTVTATDKLIIRDLLNYPNPFSTTTEITFWINQDCDVSIKIYTIAGRLICKLDNLHAEIGFNHFYWNGLDQDYDPLANGVYLYKVSANCQNGSQKIYAEKIQKCVVVR